MSSGSNSHKFLCLSLNYVPKSYEALGILRLKYPNDSGLLWFTILIWSLCVLQCITGWPAVLFSRIFTWSVRVIRLAWRAPLWLYFYSLVASQSVGLSTNFVSRMQFMWAPSFSIAETGWESSQQMSVGTREDGGCDHHGLVSEIPRRMEQMLSVLQPQDSNVMPSTEFLTLFSVSCLHTMRAADSSL